MSARIIPIEAAAKRAWRSVVPQGTSGDWRVERFEVDAAAERFQRLRCALNPHRPARLVSRGSYTRLTRRWCVVMSDTPDEMRDHAELFLHAKGRVLMHGLGLGCAASVLARMSNVTGIVVIEKSEDVIKLVMPTVTKLGKVVVVHGDALTRKPAKGERYDVVWHDIWDDISKDNIDEMRMLQRRWARRCGWQGCWSKAAIDLL